MDLPTPYYDQDGITIYHGDCREVLPTIDTTTVDLLLTDPPYGVSYQIDRQLVGKGHRRVWMGGRPPVYGDDKPFDPTPLLHFSRLILFGGNHFASKLPDSGGWIVWDKTGGGRGPNNTFADVELAWTNLSNTPRIRHHLWKGLVRDTEAGQAVLHPTQKPVSLMKWLLNDWTEPGDLVLDPYMGSGPVAQACHEMGRRYIGIEIEERYCQIAVDRLAQRVLPLGQ